MKSEEYRLQKLEQTRSQYSMGHLSVSGCCLTVCVRFSLVTKQLRKQLKSLSKYLQVYPPAAAENVCRKSTQMQTKPKTKKKPICVKHHLVLYYPEAQTNCHKTVSRFCHYSCACQSPECSWLCRISTVTWEFQNSKMRYLEDVYLLHCLVQAFHCRCSTIIQD